MVGCDTSILLYGDSGDGKTALIGEYAEHIFIKTGGKKTRLYAGDPGGYQTILPYVNLGIVDVVDLRGVPYPWEWLDAIAKGKVPDARGRWVLDQARNDQIACWAFEGGTAFGDTLLQDAARKAKRGIQVGGQAAPTFVERAADAGIAGDTNYTVTGNSPAHYGQAQSQLVMSIHESFFLPGTVIWTCTARRAGDNDNPTVQVLGPQLIGKALTSEAPRWFVYTFRVMGEPANKLLNQAAKHTLLSEDHNDVSSPGAKVLGNNRLPLDAPKIDASISPASIVKLLEKLNTAAGQAEATIAERVNRLMGPNTVRLGAVDD